VLIVPVIEDERRAVRSALQAARQGCSRAREQLEQEAPAVIAVLDDIVRHYEGAIELIIGSSRDAGGPDGRHPMGQLAGMADQAAPVAWHAATAGASSGAAAGQSCWAVAGSHQRCSPAPQMDSRTGHVPVATR